MEGKERSRLSCVIFLLVVVALCSVAGVISLSIGVYQIVDLHDSAVETVDGATTTLQEARQHMSLLSTTAQPLMQDAHKKVVATGDIIKRAHDALGVCEYVTK